MDENGQNNANVLTIKSDFDNNNSENSITNRVIFDTEKELYNEVSSTINIDVFNLAEARFERFFGYNQNEITNIERFNMFMIDVEKALKIEKNIVIEMR